MRTFEGACVNYPVDASAKISQDQLVGQNDTTKLARALVAGDVFLGPARDTADNTTGAASDINVSAFVTRLVEVDVVGADASTVPGTAVYASAASTFTLTSTNNSLVGKIAKQANGTLCVVRLASAAV